MRGYGLWAAGALALLGLASAAQADKLRRADLESDLRVETAATSAVKLRPGEPIHIRARLLNGSATRTHKVIRPGNGCSMGVVEPYVFYSARFSSHEGEPREITQPPFRGMCGMGDYRWHRLVEDLAAGAGITISERLSWASASLDMRLPGRYGLRVHYAFRRQGTKEKLPQADPVGALGPMQASPEFEIVSKPVIFDVVRPLEVFVEPIGRLAVGVPSRLQTLIRARFENWRTAGTITLDNTRLKIFVELRASKQAPRIKREAMDFPAMVVTKKLGPGEGEELIGPAAGWFDEVWTPDGKGGVELRVIVAGHASGAPRVASHWTVVPGS